MTEQTVTIYISTEVDPSQLLDLALEFAGYVNERTGESCSIDEGMTSVEETS